MKKKLPQLNEKFVTENLLGTKIADFKQEVLELPEKVIQFGEGNFLRGFVNWMFHEMNKNGIFNGSSVVIQPIPQGRVDNLNNQDFLYTVILRGIQNGKVVEKKQIVTSVSRGLKSYVDWEKILELAEKPEMEFVVSNTTEAGITYNPSDKLEATPPDSFPGKLTAYLYRRYQYFNGADDKGMIIIPVELIENNGDNLRKIIIKLAKDWGLESGFIEWIKNANTFFNTLVDRITTGYPENEIEEIENNLGYRDENMVAAEIFHSWYIEGDEKFKEKLPFHKADLNVKWVDDLKPYRTRKVRILNGAHTSTVPVSFLYGIDTVREAVNDDVVGEFISQIMFDEVIPTLDSDKEEMEDFADKIIERFKNPFIEHKWLDISLNSISKFKTRVLPSLLQYEEKYNKLPRGIVFSLASLVKFYQGQQLKENKLLATRNGEEYLINDDQSVLEFFLNLWNAYHQDEIDIKELVQQVLGNEDFWDQDLNDLPGLTDQVENNIRKIEDKGMKKCLKLLLEGELNE